MNAAQTSSLALVAFGVTEFLFRHGSTARSLRTTTSDRGTTPLIFGCYAAVVCLLFVPHLPGPVLPAGVAWVGVGAAFAGLGLRWWAMTSLGRFYTRTLTTASEQSVITRGPYRWVRHPGYLGSLLTWIGATVASRNILLLIVVTGLLLFAYARRITAEEAMLVETLGAPYSEYQRKSWKLLPFLF